MIMMVSKVVNNGGMSDNIVLSVNIFVNQHCSLIHVEVEVLPHSVIVPRLFGFDGHRALLSQYHGQFVQTNLSVPVHVPLVQDGFFHAFNVVDIVILPNKYTFVNNQQLAIISMGDENITHIMIVMRSAHSRGTQ